MKKVQSAWVLLADVVGSRHIDNRPAFEQRFQKAVSAANEQFGDSLILPMRGWKGLDEMAAVLKTPACTYELANLMNSLLAPEKLRMCIVQGQLDLVPENGDVTAADGPAFHTAAAAMQQLKRNGLLVYLEGSNAANEQTFAISINLLLLLKGGWTARQHEVFAAYRKTGSQETVANAAGVTQQTVSKTLKSIQASQVLLLETELQRALDQQYR